MNFEHVRADGAVFETVRTTNDTITHVRVASPADYQRSRAARIAMAHEAFDVIEAQRTRRRGSTSEVLVVTAPIGRPGALFRAGDNRNAASRSELEAAVDEGLDVVGVQVYLRGLNGSMMRGWTAAMHDDVIDQGEEVPWFTDLVRAHEVLRHLDPPL